MPDKNGCALPVRGNAIVYNDGLSEWARFRFISIQQSDSQLGPLLDEPVEKENTFMSEPEHIDPKLLRPGRIRHESLPHELLDQIKAVFDVIGPYINMTLEQFEIGFMRDMHPESEVALWFRIAKAWLAYHEDFLANETLPDEDEKNMLGALIAISTGINDVAKLNVPAEVGRKLIQCFDDPAGDHRPSE
jgi:hypothetical protein